jgi:hypothetical protein
MSEETDVVRVIRDVALMAGELQHHRAMTAHHIDVGVKWQNEAEDLRAELARKSAEWEATRVAGKAENKRFADECVSLRAELRALPTPLHPQDHPNYGPWIPGIPEVMDGRKVHVRFDDGAPDSVFIANGQGFGHVSHYAELRKREGE